MVPAVVSDLVSDFVSDFVSDPVSESVFVIVFLQLILQGYQCARLVLFKRTHPSIDDFLQRNGVQVVELVPAGNQAGDEVGAFKDYKMFAHCLSSHV